AWAADRLGNSTVPSATPSNAVGNSIRRSANDSQVTLPGVSQDAILVLINSEIWATETPSVAGAICLSMRRTVGSRHARDGRVRRLGSRPRRASAAHWMAN